MQDVLQITYKGLKWKYISWHKYCWKYSEI